MNLRIVQLYHKFILRRRWLISSTAHAYPLSSTETNDTIKLQRWHIVLCGAIGSHMSSSRAIHANNYARCRIRLLPKKLINWRAGGRIQSPACGRTDNELETFYTAMAWKVSPDVQSCDANNTHVCRKNNRPKGVENDASAMPPVRLLAETVSDNLWRRFCSQRTDAFSALAVSRRCAI